MRRRRNRHPVLEAAVFAAAILLAGFVGRELWKRRVAPAPAPSVMEPAKLNLSYPPLPGTDLGGRTETAVTGVPPLKLTRVQRRKPRTAVVPPPK
ncbi:MAG: hypothetical protein NUW21_02300 [Elusimicrobia bacterium]|nr:hypothetical protein [Elusimicrobiota bacterium]